MISLVEEKKEALGVLCETFHVRRLELFGSAVGMDFDPARSDIDLIVDFEYNSPAMHYDCYFGLFEGLEHLLGCSVDLIEYAAL